MPPFVRLATLLALLAATGCVIVPQGPLTGPNVQPEIGGPAGAGALAPHLPPANAQAPLEGAAGPREGAPTAPACSASPGAACPSPTPAG